jgi:hypothetical protein
MRILLPVFSLSVLPLSWGTAAAKPAIKLVGRMRSSLRLRPNPLPG